MISWMQKHRKYLVITIWISTIAFVGAGFLGWGAYKFSIGDSQTIEKVGDVKITNKEFQIKYSNIYNLYNRLFGGKLTKEKAKELKLQDLALAELENEALLLNYAKEFKITATKKEILKEIANFDMFKVNGEFSQSRFEYILKSMGISSTDFMNEVKKSLIIDKLFKALKLPNQPLEEKTIFASLFLQDKIKYKLLTLDNFKANIDENEIKSFWEKNKNKYKSKTKYDLELVKVSLKDINVTDEEIKKFYNQKRYLFKDQDGKILPLNKAYEFVKREVKYKKAKKQILKKYIKFKKGELKAEEEINVFKFNSKIPMEKIITAKEKEYIKAIKTPNGYVSVYIKKIILPQVLPYEKAKKYAKEELLKIKQQKFLEESAKKILKQDNFKDAKESDFFTKSDLKKINFLAPYEAKIFLEYLFNQITQKGYYVFSQKAIVYKIIDQKLYDKNLFKKNKTYVSKITNDLKNKEKQSNILNILRQKYEIKRYYSTTKDES